MVAELLVDRAGPLGRAAIVEAGRLAHIEIDRLDRPSPVGAIHRARVGRAAPGLGTFVALGDGTTGLVARPGPGGPGRGAGAGVVVQVTAASTAPDKAATVTTDPILAGRLLLHRPLAADQVAASARAGDRAARAALARRVAALTGGGAWIARAAAAAAGDDQLRAEAAALRARGRAVAAAAAGGTPAVIAPGPDAAARAVIAWGGRPLDTVRVEPAGERGRLGAGLDALAPGLSDRLVPHRPPPPLFDLHDLDSQLDALMRPRVALPSGGNLMIEPTEALVAVDVNPGVTAGGGALNVELAAAAELARQLRLRHLGGMIVADFPATRRGGSDGERVLVALRAATADDPEDCRVLGITRLGLIELSRRRRGPSLAEIVRAASARGA